MDPSQIISLLMPVAITLFMCISVGLAIATALGFVTRSRPLQMAGYGGVAFIMLAILILWTETVIPMGPTQRVMGWIMLFTGSFSLCVPLSAMIAQRNVQGCMKQIGDDMKKDPSLDPQTAAGAARILNDLAKQKHY